MLERINGGVMMYVVIPFRGTIVDTDGEVNILSLLNIAGRCVSFDIMADKDNTDTILLASITGVGNSDILNPGDVRNDMGIPSAMSVSTLSTTPQTFIIHYKVDVGGD